MATRTERTQALVKDQRRAYPAAAAFFAYLLPWLVEKAREHGYALAVHGSMATDLDLIAVPWVDDAADAETLVEAIRVVVNGIIPNDPSKDQADYGDLYRNPTERPHGRRAWSIYMEHPFCGPYIDLSVMPRGKT